MSLALERPTLSPEDYLAAERRDEIRHEYLNGETFAMSGASRRHNRIVWNLVEKLGPALRARGCEGFANDMRVQVEETGLYTYPDLVVVCGEPQFADRENDTLLNPTLIVEVLSPTTEDYDRGRKFAHYRTIPTLGTYVVIAQDRRWAEKAERQPSQTWLFTECRDLEATLELPAIGLVLPLADIYAGV